MVTVAGDDHGRIHNPDPTVVDSNPSGSLPRNNWDRIQT